MLIMDNVSRSFGKRKALVNFSLAVPEGSTQVIMGPSGCGKSTALRCVIRLIQPDSGDIIYNGRSVMAMGSDELRAFRRKIGFVFQRSNLVMRLTVLENVMLPQVSSGVSEGAAKARALGALESVGMAGRSASHPGELSGGEMQRVAIARAIAGRPGLILWDEPTASLDPLSTVEVLGVIEQVISDTGATMIIVTHEIPFAMRVADRIALVECGSVVEEGFPTQVLEKPKTRLGLAYATCMAYSSGGRKENSHHL